MSSLCLCIFYYKNYFFFLIIIITIIEGLALFPLSQYLYERKLSVLICCHKFYP